jgi:hypothetical protein
MERSAASSIEQINEMPMDNTANAIRRLMSSVGPEKLSGLMLRFLPAQAQTAGTRTK